MNDWDVGTRHDGVDRPLTGGGGGERAEHAGPVRVMLVDDDPVVRMGLRHLIGTAHDLHVVAEASDGDEVVAAVLAHRPDVIVLDVRMARVGGIETIAAVKARPEAPHVLMFTVFDHDDVARRAIRAGADGFLLKTAAPTEICDGIRNVARGLGAVSPKTASQLFAQVREDPAQARRADAAALMASLTPREREVVAALARGLSNAQMARELFVSDDHRQDSPAERVRQARRGQHGAGRGHRRPFGLPSPREPTM